MAHPYRDGTGKAKLKRMLGQAPGTNVGKFADAPATEAEIGRHVEGYDVRMPGGVEKSKTRLDRRARGGGIKKKGHHTTVNVLVGGGKGAPQPTPVPVPVPAGGGGPAPMPPRPPMMPPPGAMGAPGAGPMGPGGPPPGAPPMPPRASGGKVVGDKGPASGHSRPNPIKKGQRGWKVPRIHLKPKAPEKNTRG